MRILASVISLAALVLSVGCQPAPIDTGAPVETPVSPVATQPPSSPTPAPTAVRNGHAPTRVPERISPTEAGTPVTGEVPSEILDAILADLSTRAATPADQIAVIRVEATVWNDGSLGCAQPGESYTQAQVNGYWVVLEVDTRSYDYRAADNGYFFLCENGLPLATPPSTPNS